MDITVEDALEIITKFLERWYPPEIAPLVLKKQINATGAVSERMTEKDLNLLLSRLQMVILPTFMPSKDAAKEIRKLKKELGIRY